MSALWALASVGRARPRCPRHATPRPSEHTHRKFYRTLGSCRSLVKEGRWPTTLIGSLPSLLVIGRHMPESDHLVRHCLAGCFTCPMPHSAAVSFRFPTGFLPAAPVAITSRMCCHDIRVTMTLDCMHALSVCIRPIAVKRLLLTAGPQIAGCSRELAESLASR